MSTCLAVAQTPIQKDGLDSEIEEALSIASEQLSEELRRITELTKIIEETTARKRREAAAKIEWGQNVDDFIHLFLDLPEKAPRRAQLVSKLLQVICKSRRDFTDDACKFTSEYEQYKANQAVLKKMINEKTYKNVEEESEITFRAVNFNLYLFSLNIQRDPKTGITEPIRVLVNWMYQRRALASRLDDVDRLFARYPHSDANSARWVLIPALKAYFSSPLLIGQINAFLESQKFPKKSVDVYSEANRQVQLWILDIMQKHKAHIENLQQVFEQRIHQSKNLSVSGEIEVLGELYKNDRVLRSDHPAEAEQYAKWLDNQILTIFGAPSPERGQAAIGVILVSEILHIFHSWIPEQAPLSSSLIHKDLPELEQRIQAEIDGPISNLNQFLYLLEKDLQ